MSESKPTKGPWFNWKKKKWLYEPQKLLANYEDACLIASAPDLLDALEEVMRWFGKLEDWTGVGDPDIDAWRAAIKKAKGENND